MTELASRGNAHPDIVVSTSRGQASFAVGLEVHRVDGRMVVVPQDTVRSGLHGDGGSIELSNGRRTALSARQDQVDDGKYVVGQRGENAEHRTVGAAAVEMHLVQRTDRP